MNKKVEVIKRTDDEIHIRGQNGIVGKYPSKFPAYQYIQSLEKQLEELDKLKGRWIERFKRKSKENRRLKEREAELVTNLRWLYEHKDCPYIPMMQSFSIKELLTINQ